MPATVSQSLLSQDCLGKLNQILGLAMHTAEAASAEGNHRIVLQAVREVTRIITLMNKIAVSREQEPKPAPAQNHAQPNPLGARNSTSGTMVSGLDLLQETLLSLAQPQAVQPTTGSPKLETEKCLFQKREKGGKLAGKDSFINKMNDKYQNDRSCEKNAANFPQNGL